MAVDGPATLMFVDSTPSFCIVGCSGGWLGGGAVWEVTSMFWEEVRDLAVVGTTVIDGPDCDEELASTGVSNGLLTSEELPLQILAWSFRHFL